MAEQNGKANESLDNKGAAQDNGISDEALLFDEATVLSRSEDTAEKEQRIDNASVGGKAQDSGNENIQASVSDRIYLDQTRYGHGDLREEERFNLQDEERSESEGSLLDPVDQSNGRQQSLQQNDDSIRNTDSQPADFSIENPDGTSNAAINDFVEPLQSLSPQATAESQPEGGPDNPETPRTPEPELNVPEEQTPDEIDVSASITIDVIAGDDVLNAQEAEQVDTTITGTVGGDVQVGDEVTLTVNGNTYTGDVFENDAGELVYSIDVKTDDLEADNSIDASVTATDAAGNTATAEADRDISVDTEIEASITIDVIAGDDVLNAQEAGQVDTTITGTVGGDVQVGDEVTLTVNGNTYTGDVFENDAGELVYSIDVKTDDLEADNSIDASVTATDAAGNKATAEADRDISLDGTGFGGASKVLEDSGEDALTGNVFADGNHFGENPQIETFNYTDVNGDTQTANAGDTVTTLHGGDLTVNGNGSWSYTPPVSGDHSGETDDALEGAGFEYTASIDGGNTYIAEQAISVLDDEPIALEDTDTVALDADLNGFAFGNVMTGMGGSSLADLKADDEGPDTAQVTEVRFGETKVRLDNNDDVKIDDDGNQYVEIAGDNGLLKLYQDGSYNYEVTDPTTTKTVDDGNWDTVTLKAFDFGTEYKGSDGKLDLTKADDTVSEAGNGIGVSGTQNGNVSKQINHNYDYNAETGETGQSESLAVSFDNPITKATVSLSNLYKNDNGGEAGDIESGRWEAFDADGNLVGYGVLDDSTIDYTNGHQGTAVIELPGSGAFSTIVFSATAYDNPAINTGDSSDYFIKSISYEEVNTAADQFTYQITDTDGDTAETTLTLDLAAPEAEITTLPDLLDVSITIDPITGDDLLNVKEVQEATTTITGTVGGDASEGDTVTLTVNGNHYTGQVTADNTYNINVDTSDLQADNDIDASISIKNDAGLTATAKAEREIDTEGFSFKLFVADNDGNIMLDSDGNPVDVATISEPGSVEGDSTAYYIVKAVDSDGIPLADQPGGNIEVVFENNSAENEDYATAQGGSDFGQGSGAKTVAVNEKFSATAEDDALADNGETFTISLNDGSYTNADDFEGIGYDAARVTTTIKDETETDTPNDNDSAFTLKLFASDDQGNILLDSHGDPITATEIHEDSANGDTTAYYVVKAVDGNGDLLTDQPEGTVDVTFTNDSAEDTDYTYGNTNVTVGQAFSATSVDDALADNNEDFVVSLNAGSYSNAAAYEAVSYASDTVTTTILDETDNDPATPGDNDSAFTLKLFASDDQGNILLDSHGDPITATEIHEDSANGDTTAYYVVKAVDGNGDLLTDQPEGTVDVTFTNDSAEDTDYTYGNTNVTVGQAFSATSVDDALADNNEDFVVSLNAGSYSDAAAYEAVSYASDTVTTTILDETDNDPATPGDNDSAFTLKLFASDDQGNVLLDSHGDPITATEIHEDSANGDTTAYYVVKAVDGNGDLLTDQPEGTVDVTFTNDSAEDTDYTYGNTNVTVGQAFSATSVDDALADNNEDFVVSLNAGSYSDAAAYEAVSYASDTVTTTILDETDNDPATPGDNDSAFTLKLFASDDQGNVLLDSHGDPVTATQIHEDGETSAFYVVKALDENNNFVDLEGTVDVRFDNHTAESGDYAIEGTEVTLGQAFSARAVDDKWTDNNETFTVELVENSYSEDAAYTADGAYETVTYDDAGVTTTIRDLDFRGIEDNRNTLEGDDAGGDWDIPILQNLDQIHSGDDFSSITISNIPTGATLKDGDGNTLTPSGGEYTVSDWQDALNLTITPAVDSSADITLDYELSLENGSVASFTQSIVITPEADQPWTLGELGSESVTYQNTLLEDSGWQHLNAGWVGDSTVFSELSASTGDADGSEHNTVVRFFSDGDTNMPAGTKLRFENEEGQIETFTFNNSNTYTDIPADKLDTLQIKTPSNFNGELNLKIKTAVVDQDENGSGSDNRWSDNGDTNQKWGEPDLLTINVSGDADLSESLISVKSVIASEDSGRDQETGALTQNADGTYDVSGAIDLEIDFRQWNYTNTEVLEFKVEGIPDDTFIFDKDGHLLNGDGSGGSLSSLKIVLDPSNGEHYTAQPGEVVLTSKSAFNGYVENLKLIPAHDSNEDFTLTINQKSTEPNWDGSVGGEQTQEVTDTFEVQLTGVADGPIVTGTDAPIVLNESGDWQNLSGFQIASGEEQHQSEEVYALIRNVPNDVGLRIVDGDGNELFDQLVLADADGSSTDWRIDNETLQKVNAGEYKIQLKTPDEDYSGSLDFNIRVTVLDIDSDSGQATDTLVSDHTMNIVVQPEVEEYGDSQSYGNEDQWIELGLRVGAKDGDALVEDKYDFNDQTYDLKIEIPGLGETSENIQVHGDNLAIDYANNLVYLNQEDLSSVEVLAPQHSNEDLSGIQFHRYLKDDMDDSSTNDEDIQEVITGHTVNVSGVADGWEDIDHTENATTDDTEGSDYDGFIVQDIAGGTEAVEGSKAISHVVIKFENGDTFKIDEYGSGAEITDYGHPQRYFEDIEQTVGSDVVSYLVKAGSNNQEDGGYFDPFTGEVVAPESYGFTVKSNGNVDVSSVANRSNLVDSGPDSSVTSDNVVTSLTDIIVRNDNVEDHYHDNNDTYPTADTSESEYYIVQNQSGADNTTWMVEGGINAGGGVWVVPADALNNANIKILQPGAGDGSLNLEIVPVSKEDDGDVKFDQAHTFTIEYAGGSDSIVVGENGSLVIDGGTAPTITISSKDSGLEDTSVEDVLSDTSASGGAELSFVIDGTATNGSVDTTGMYQLPDGSYVGTGAINFKPNADFNGDVGFGVNIIATDDNGNQSFASENITLDINPVLDESNISAEGGTETDGAAGTESIALNLQISSSDTDGSETLQGDITITPQDGGSLTGEGVTDNGDGSYTVSVEHLGSVEFVPDAYSHGTYSFAIQYEWTDEDTNGGTDVTKTIESNFSIDLASQVDQIDINLNPTSGIDEGEEYPLDLSVIQHDDDGSEVASVKITGIPDALVIHDAEGNKIGNYSDNGDGTVTIVLKGSEVPEDGGLKLYDTTGTYGGSFTADVTALSFDKVTKEIATDDQSVELTINPVASAILEVDAGSAQSNKIEGVEDNVGMPLDLDVIMTDLDGSERLKITFGDEFTNEGFRAEYTDAAGNTKSLTDESLLSPEEAQSIKLIPQNDYSGDMQLTVNVQSVEVDENGNATDVLDTAVSKMVTVIVEPEADGVTVTGITDKSVVEDSASVDIGLNLELEDSSELLNLNLNGLEPGSVVSVTGQDLTVGNSGSVDFTGLTESEAESLSVQPPENYNGTMNIDVSVKTVDGDDVLDTAVTQSFSLEVMPEADDLEISDAGGSGAEDSTISLGLDLELVDSSELLNVTVSGHEAGSVISVPDGSVIGTVNDDGSVSFENLTLSQAETLQITPPDDYSGAMSMAVSVRTVDGNDILDSAVTQSFDLNVTAEADQPDLSDPMLANEFENDDGTFSYDLSLSASLTDSSEELSLRIDGIPDNCVLTNSDGDSLSITNGSITLSPAQLTGLKLTSPEPLASDGVDGLNIEATAISTETMGTQDTSDDVSAIQTKTIIDGVIEGLAYTTSSGLSGLTDQHGNFEHREGDSVTFKVGDIEIGTLTPEDLLQGTAFLQDIANVDRSDLNDEYVENMGVFLQSLDADGNPDNGITITSESHAAFEGVEIDLRTASEEEVQSVIERAGRTAISEEQAMDHIQRMLEEHSDQTEFEEHVDDSVSTAVLAKEPIEGLSYETSSGLSGEMDQGRFEFDDGDSVNIYAGDQLVATFDSSDIGDDSVITFEEAGFVVGHDELSQLLNGEPLNNTDTESVAETSVVSEDNSEELDASDGLDAADDEDFGADTVGDMELSGINDLFMFGEDQPQGLLDALENGVQSAVDDQSWFSQVESDQDNADTDSFGDFEVDSAADEAGYLSDDDQPCEW